MGLNVHVHIYRDREWLPGAVESVRDVLGNVPIHLFDGRYDVFPGETDLTPGLAEWCADRDGVHYHAPPADALPLGHDSDVPDDWRPHNHAKATWAIEETIPQADWTLKLDADERLRSFDTDLDALDRTRRYGPVIERVGADEAVRNRVYIARLFVPEYWTAWIGDCLLPRALFPRDTPLEIRQRLWTEPDFRPYRTVRLDFLDSIHIDNHDAERDPDRQARRRAHLEAIGRDDHPIVR